MNERIDTRMIPTAEPMQKVAIFCFAGERLLVIHHPLAGTQIPAGTIEPGESPDDAAVRELLEETSLSDVELVRVDTIMRVRDDGVCHALSDIELTEGTIPRGHRVEVTAVRDGEASFEYVTRDYNTDPPKVVSSWRGQAPLESLSLRTERHLYRGELRQAPAAPWSLDADGHHWTCRLEPAEDVQLFMKQQEWLEHVLRLSPLWGEREP